MDDLAHQTDAGSVARVANSPKPEPVFRKRFNESFRFTSSSLRHHSRTQSICSSASSAHIFDSDTTYSASTVASPISTVYESENEDVLYPSLTDRASLRLAERRRQYFASFDSGSTWVGDRDDEDKSDKLEKFMSTPLEYPSSPGLPLAEDGEDGEHLKSPAAAQPLVDDDASVSGNSKLDCSDTEGVISPQTLMCDASSVATDEGPGSDVHTLLAYTLQLVYGLDATDLQHQLGHLRHLSAKYIRDVGNVIWQSPNSDGEQSNSQGTSCWSSTSSPTEEGRRGSQSASSQSGGGSKRKKDYGPEEGGQGSGQGSGFTATKKAKHNVLEDDNLRLSCPFRKRNPHRFNVRDHHSCAMTYFPKFAELRQHIVKQHKRDDPSAFVCDRCNRDFRSRKELRDHQRRPKEFMCDLADHDPESGIDGPTCNKLLSRKRASGASSAVQWKEVWNLLFPDDDDHMIQPFTFIPVIEHFELASQFYASFDHLRATLQDKISNPATLDTISTKFHHCFAETIGKCLTTAQGLPYVNRSNKKSEISRNAPLSVQTTKRKSRIQPRPDSGIVMDDGSEESGSVTSSGLHYNDSDAVLSLMGSGDHRCFVFGGSSSTPATSMQTPTSAFNPDLLGLPGYAQLLPDAPGLPSVAQVDFTRLWGDETLYDATGAGPEEQNVQQPRDWEETPPCMSFHISSGHNMY